jgi:hypothetical protein
MAMISYGTAPKDEGGAAPAVLSAAAH